MKILTNIDLNKNELQNFKLQNLATAPQAPTQGQPYYNTTDKVAYIWDGTRWKNLFSMSIEEIVTLINNSNLKIDDDNLSSNVNDAISKRHGHSNKTILDAITQALIDKWNNAESNAKQYADNIKPTKTSQLTNDSDFATNSSVDNKIDNYKVKPATSTTLGGIKVGANLYISPEGILNANDNPASFIPRQEVFVVKPGQTVFSLEKGSYKPNTGTICWFMEGSKQPNDVLQELSSTSFSIKGGLDAGTEIIVEYIELINASPYPIHSKEHLTGGIDPIPKVTTNSDGLMAKEDKSKVDGITPGANKVENSSKNGVILIDGVEQNVYSHPSDDNNRHVSDSEKSTWNSKETPQGAQAKADSALNNAKSYADSKANEALNNAKGYTDTKVSALVNSAPAALDTLQELSKALGDDPNFATTVAKQIGEKETPSGAQAKANIAENNAKAVANAHAGDNTRHITANERNYWNSRTGKATEFVLKHNLNTLDTTVSIREPSTREWVMTDILTVDVNTIKVLFAQPPATNQYRVTVVG